MHPRQRISGRQLSRRDFLRQSAGAAVAFSGAGAFLAACGRASDPNLVPSTAAPPSASGTPSVSPSPTGFPLARPDNPVTWPIYPDNQPIASGLSPERGATLKVYNWEDYLYLDLTKDFAKEFNCEVEVSTYGGVDEALDKLRTGQVDFDVYFPDPSLVGKLVASKLIQPLNLDYIPNLSNCWPNLQSPFYDVESRYTVPYVLYTTGIGWRNDKVPVDLYTMDNPYEIYWDPAYRGKVHVFDDYRESITMALLKNGFTDINTEDPAQIQVARDDLALLVDVVNVKLDINDYTHLPEGSAWIHQAWSGDMVSAQYYLPKGGSVETLSYWFPPDGGGAIASDNIVIPRAASNPVLAHAFLNFLLDSEVAYSNFYNFTGYQPPMNDIDADRLIADGAVPANLASAVVRAEDFDTNYFLLELSPAGDALWHAAYQAFAAGV